MSRSLSAVPSPETAAHARRMLDSTPMGHRGSPQGIAYGVLCLASDESRFVTGTELVVDGGLSHHPGSCPGASRRRTYRKPKKRRTGNEEERTHHGADAGLHHRIAGHRAPADAAVPHP
ncbi:SDR family oxidoreductase [Streptomyces sp. R-74717]|uniref:SDR family oxidoreductase n=1 Tax=Streptomyces sp. R-74717 TaxID=2969820 RepID=UPI0039B54AF7